MGIQINGNTDNISAVDGGLTVSDLELNQTGVSTFHSHLHVADQIIHLGDANTKIRFPAADSITAETGGSERLRIDSSGRIGVGVVPTAQYAHNLIQIGHQATLGANAALSATGQTFLTHNLYFDTGGTLKVFNTSNANEGAIFRLVDGQLLFSNSAATTGTPTVTERFRITSTGEIKQYGFTGSSDTSADDLVLGNTTGGVNRGMTIWSNSSQNGALVFADNDSNFRGAVQYIHNGDSLRFLTAGSERLRIDSSGRVLIGTTDPGGGNADDLTVATSGNTGITIRSGTSNTGNIFFSDATSGAAQYAGAIEFHHSDNSLNLNVSNTNRLRIQSNGKFGLNRSAPQYAMHLSPADGDTRIDIHMTNSTTGHNNNDGVQFGYQNSAGAYIWNFENTPIYFGTANTERLRIDSSGRVMIGTTTEGNGNADEFTISYINHAGVSGGDQGRCGMTIRSGDNTSGVTQNGYIYFSDGTSGANESKGVVAYEHSNDAMYFSTDQVARLRIDSSGRVTKPYTPAFLAYHHSYDVNYGPNATLPYMHTVYNTGNHYNTSNSTFTAPIAGRYLFSANANGNFSSSYGGIPRAYWKINGSNVGNAIHLRGSDATHDGLEQRSQTVIFNLAANDTVKIVVGQNQWDLFGANSFTGYLIG